MPLTRMSRLQLKTNNQCQTNLYITSTVLLKRGFVFMMAMHCLEQACQTRFSSRATSGIFNLKRVGPVKSLHNILL